MMTEEKKLTPLTEGQQYVLHQVAAIRKVMDREGVADDAMDEISQHLYNIFVQDDFTTHLSLLLSDELEQRLGNEFNAVFEQITAEANDATADDLNRIRSNVEAEAGVQGRSGIMA